ncbi:hypothetical protein FSP39_023431 [Pinctada imbricata]|uniref:Sulfotransferase domain-containing protein n=1 Tax=Pinctada imbricata TaxID=66713 RepID=A0AA88YSK3_PINIB|nr:hypothetical protein FSP39_023431 [Pinctada imbricata]
MLLTGETNYLEYEFSRDVTFLPNMNVLEHQVSPRFLSLHLPYKWFPMSHIKRGGKIVHVTRNPKDTYVSYYHHAVEGLQYGLNTGSMTWNDFFDQCLITKNLLFGSWFDYEKEMSLAKKSNKNIYTIHYELLKKDPEKEIDGLSKFLGVCSNEQLVKDIAVKCQFQTFKSNLQNREVHPDISEMVANMQTKVPNVYRKGIVGDWKNYFTVAQNELFEEMYEKEMDGYAVKVIY